MSDKEMVNAQVRALERLDLEGLRGEWRRRYGCPPRLRSRELLGLTLAWKIQAEAFGGLDPVVRRKLRSTAAGPRKTMMVASGVVLTREWKGVAQQVVATDEGFEWNGRSYTSLSAVARAITGVRWSGTRFFGLTGARRG